MKQIQIILMAVSIVSCVVLCTRADEWTDPETGYTWTYCICGDAVEVRAISPKPKGTITVPSKLGGKPVMGIGGSAFISCSWIKRVKLPDSVLNIGNSAFARCGGLTSIEMPSVVNIGDDAFVGCSGLTSVEMPNVTSIGRWAFARGAFERRSSLASVTMPNVVNIGGCAFYDCSSLTSVTMPNVVNIGDHAFYDCSSLTSVTIPNVTSIGGSAFSGCSGLTSVTIPSSTTNIAAGAFLGCSALTAFSVDETNPKYKSVSGLLLTKDGKTLVCGVNGEVMVPDSVTDVGDYAFYGFKALTNVTFGIGAAYFGKEVFRSCDSLKKIVFKGNAPEVGPASLPGGVVTYVEKGSVGWNGGNSKGLPEKWCGSPIRYIGQEEQPDSKKSLDRPFWSAPIVSAQRRPNGSEEELLEPALSLKEAVALAKKNDPRGYYQLAIIISQKRDWGDKSFDAAGYMEFFLQKAVDAGYRNAQFLDALLADQSLSGDIRSPSFEGRLLRRPGVLTGGVPGVSSLERPDQLIVKYTGFKRGWLQSKGSLSSKEDVKAIMDRYQKLVADGCHQATNAIALLVLRAKRAEEKMAKDAAKMSASDEMVNLVRSVAELPVKKKLNASDEFAKEAASVGAVYIKSTGKDTKDVSWRANHGELLFFELYDENEGLTRLLKFRSDGVLFSVSTAH